MTSLTLVTLAVVIYGAIGGHGYGRALALGGATSAGAALAFGSLSVPTFYAVAIGCAVAICVRFLGDGLRPSRRREKLPPGVTWLLLFFGWSVIVTLLSPLVFDGMPIVSPTATNLVAGGVTTSNIAQIIYLALGISVVVFLARSPKSTPAIIGLSVGLAIALSFWRYLSQTWGLPFPEGFFDNSPGFVYIETAPGGVERFRGIFTEPSALAGSALVAVAYMISRSVQVTGLRRFGCVVMAAIAGFLGYHSTSTTFVVAGTAAFFVIATVLLMSFLARRTRMSAKLGVVGCALTVVAVFLLPMLSNFISGSVLDKIGTASYSERSDADSESYAVFFESFGMGVGLGSGRASSFLPTLLSTVGLIGTLLFVAVIVTLLVRSFSVQEYRPVVWALVTLLIVKLVAGPDLSEPTGLLWMTLGLLSHAVLISSHSRESSKTRGGPDQSLRLRPGPPRQAVLSSN